MKNRAAEIHAGLKQPVIDGDGHWLEPVPVFLEYLRDVGGAQSVDRMRALWQRTHAWYRSTWSQRQHDRIRRSNWWGVTSKTLDKATALIKGNSISHNWYTGATWTAYGLLIMDAKGVKQQANTFLDNQVNLGNFGRGGGITNA